MLATSRWAFRPVGARPPPSGLERLRTSRYRAAGHCPLRGGRRLNQSGGLVAVALVSSGVRAFARLRCRRVWPVDLAPSEKIVGLRASGPLPPHGLTFTVSSGLRPAPVLTSTVTYKVRANPECARPKRGGLMRVAGVVPAGTVSGEGVGGPESVSPGGYCTRNPPSHGCACWSTPY